MGAVWLRFRAETRSRWRASIALAVLIGIAGGSVIGLVAGARRTDTAYPRLVEEQQPFDVALQSRGPESPFQVDEIRTLPGVAEAYTISELPGFLVTPPEEEVAETDIPRFLAGADEGGVDLFGRSTLLDGRHADPDRADEVVVDFSVSENLDLDVGDPLRVSLATPEQMEAVFTTGEPPDPDAGTLVEAQVVGVVAIAGTFPPANPTESLGTIVFTPALLRAHEGEVATLGLPAVRLDDGEAAVPDFQRDMRELAGDVPVEFLELRLAHEETQKAIDAPVNALWVLAALGAVAGLLVVGQAISRQTALGSDANPTLRALGSSRAQLAGVAMVRAAAVGVVGALLALAVAVLLSPLFPVGLARTAEPDPGFDVDVLAFTIGGLVTLAAVLGLAVIPAWRAAATPAVATELPAPSSRTARLLGAFRRPVTAAAGLRLALQSGRGHAQVPVLSTVAGVALCVATIATAVTVESSLDRLLSTPSAYGWNWDLQINDGFGPDYADLTQDLAERHPVIADLSGGTVARLRSGSEELDAIAVEPLQGDLRPTVLAGRTPEAPDELMLGAKTMRDLGLAIGDVVDLEAVGVSYEPVQPGPSQEFEIVGEAVTPQIGDQDLGEGVLLPFEGLAQLTASPPAHNLFFVGWGEEGDRDAVLDELEALDAATLTPIPPIDLANFARIEGLPLLMAGLMTVLALAFLAHLLVTSVSRRRRDLAVLKSLGFTRRQVSATVVWAAGTIVALALIVGVPVGIAAGRWTWRLLAGQIGVLADPETSEWGLVLFVAGAFVVTSIVALVPAWLAARTRPARVIRRE